MSKDRILIVNDSADCGAPYGPLFSTFGEVCHDPAQLKLNPYDFKLMVFTGGADVSPDYYGDTSPHKVCWSNPARDKEEKMLFNFGKQHTIKMVGICRGMQFLNVMTGGKMMHDIKGHSGGNHQVMVRDRDEPFITNSFHHQMCIPSSEAELIAWSHQKLSKSYIGDKDEPVDYKGPEVEALYMPWYNAFGVQWHPECMPTGELGRTWFMHVVRDLINRTRAEMKKLYLGQLDRLYIKEVN
jgi:gamma-glutamyl-gamma-aminobutyrate hydrolase PuuD